MFSCAWSSWTLKCSMSFVTFSVAFGRRTFFPLGRALLAVYTWSSSDHTKQWREEDSSTSVHGCWVRPMKRIKRSLTIPERALSSIVNLALWYTQCFFFFFSLFPWVQRASSSPALIGVASKCVRACVRASIGSSCVPYCDRDRKEVDLWSGVGKSKEKRCQAATIECCSTINYSFFQ